MKQVFFSPALVGGGGESGAMKVIPVAESVQRKGHPGIDFPEWP